MKRHQLLNLLQASKNGFLLGAGVSLCFYAVIRVMFYEFGLTLAEEIINVIKIVFIGGVIISTGIVSFLSLEMLIKYLSRLKPQLTPVRTLRVAAVCILVLGVVVVNAQPMKTAEGLRKNQANGFTTKYSGMTPSKSYMSMNNEVLNHSDVVMGESFLVVNENVKGLVEKDGKVSVGCSITVTDKTGKKLVTIADVYKGKDILTPREASTLKCSVPTTKLTGWEEKYDVVVTFWDKYGKGSIVNKVKIRMIDLP